MTGEREVRLAESIAAHVFTLYPMDADWSMVCGDGCEWTAEHHDEDVLVAAWTAHVAQVIAADEQTEARR